MCSKKKRKFLKQQYNNHNNYKPIYHNENKLQQDRETILNYLKERKDTYLSKNELIKNCYLNYYGKSEITNTIKHIIQFYNINIKIKPGKNGGYMYYE